VTLLEVQPPWPPSLVVFEVGPTLPDVLVHCPPLLVDVQSAHDEVTVVEGSTGLLLVLDQSCHSPVGTEVGAIGGQVQTSVMGQYVIVRVEVTTTISSFSCGVHARATNGKAAAA
jgi:hypothetical protein